MILITTLGKISRLIVAAVLVASFACSNGFADEDVREKPIYALGTGTTVSVSAATWTKAPTASSLSRRSGIKVSNPATNSATIYGVLSAEVTTPVEATTVHPIEIQPGENPFIPCGDGIFLYLLSSSGSVNVHAQEVRQ